MDNSYFLLDTACHIYVSDDTVEDTYSQDFAVDQFPSFGCAFEMNGVTKSV